MKKCPHCFEDLGENCAKEHCPYCALSLPKKLPDLDYPSVDRKRCYFCGGSIAKEANYCRHCRKWIDEVDHGLALLDDLEEK